MVLLVPLLDCEMGDPWISGIIFTFAHPASTATPHIHPTLPAYTTSSALPLECVHALGVLCNLLRPRTLRIVTIRG